MKKIRNKYDERFIMTSIINRIKCAINCLRGRPTLYGFTFNKGYIETEFKNGTYVVNNKFMNESGIKI